MELFDSHAHYNDIKFEEDREELLKSIYDSGVTSIICAGYNLESSKQAIEIANSHDYIYATVGISPNDLEENWENDLINIEKILEDSSYETKNNKIVAVGEIGLDYHYDTDKTIQKHAFIKQIEIANKYNLPIVIHTRDAVMDTIEILKQHPVNKKGVFHCCPFNRELIKEALKLDFYISIAGPITFKNSKNADEIIKMVPLDRIVIETDSPYLSPEPHRGKRNDSRNLIHIAEKIALVKELSLEEIAKITFENACKLYSIRTW